MRQAGKVRRTVQFKRNRQTERGTEFKAGPTPEAETELDSLLEKNSMQPLPSNSQRVSLIRGPAVRPVQLDVHKADLAVGCRCAHGHLHTRHGMGGNRSC